MMIIIIIIKLLNVVKNMYDKAKSCIKKENLDSDYFPCNIEVRQCDKLSPFVFARRSKYDFLLRI